MPRRLHPVLVELADFRLRFTWQCPRSFCRAAPPNGRVQPRREAKRRRVEALVRRALYKQEP